MKNRESSKVFLFITPTWYATARLQTVLLLISSVFCAIALPFKQFFRQLGLHWYCFGFQPFPRQLLTDFFLPSAAPKAVSRSLNCFLWYLCPLLLPEDLSLSLLSVCTHTYGWCTLCVYIYTFMYVYLGVWVHARAQRHTYICAYMYMYTCVYLCIYICIRV